jgi:hypothetical protein
MKIIFEARDRGRIRPTDDTGKFFWPLEKFRQTRHAIESRQSQIANTSA